MLRSNEIANIMNSITGKLMPLSVKEFSNELWPIYNQLQEWKVAIEWKHPRMGSDRSAHIARAILKKLKTLSDRKLAQEIRHAVKASIRH